MPPLEPRRGGRALRRACARDQSRVRADAAVLPALPRARELAARARAGRGARQCAFAGAVARAAIDHRLALLRAGRGVDPRQRTLRATIEWSYELLDSEERQLFRRLAVFAGGFTLDAAEEVCAADLDVLQSLVEKSLVRKASARFSMLETIRAYAAEKLAGSRDERQTRLAHAMHFASLAEEAALDEPTRKDQPVWLDRLTVEHENFRTALDFADSQGLVDVELRLVRALRSFWFLRGFWSEGRAYLERALDRAEAKPSEIRVGLLSTSAQLAERQGDYDRARALDSEHLRLARELGDERKLANALMRARIGAEVRGDFYLARVHLAEVLAISARSGDDWFAARARLKFSASRMSPRTTSPTRRISSSKPSAWLARSVTRGCCLHACTGRRSFS